MNISRPSRALLYGLIVAGVLIYALVWSSG